MNISKVSFFSANPRQNFTGIFKEVNRDKDEDPEQRYEVTTIQSIYYPNKDETEEEIKAAMDEYNSKYDEYGGGMVPDGGIDEHGNPTMTQAWVYSTFYSCTRGKRLPF